MLLHNVGGRLFSKPLLIISEGCCSLPENISGLKWKYITVHSWLSSDFFENDFGNWLNFLGLCCWKWFQHIWRVFALCESNFLERHAHVLSVKYSSCFSPISLPLHLYLPLLQPPSFSPLQTFPPPSPIVSFLDLPLTLDTLNPVSGFCSLTQFMMITVTHLQAARRLLMPFVCIFYFYCYKRKSF